MKKILFVCTGNTCRSPMAEGFLKAAITKDPQLFSKYYAESAGINTYKGAPASDEAIEIMHSEWGIDLSGHSSSPLSHEAVQEAFLILTMELNQKEKLLAAYPEASDKIYALKEFARGNRMYAPNSRYDGSMDISDPYGSELDVYSLCAKEIKTAVDLLLQKL